MESKDFYLFYIHDPCFYPFYIAPNNEKMKHSGMTMTLNKTPKYGL